MSANRSSVLDRVITLGLLAIVILAPTQYSFEISDKTYLSVVDPLVWATALLWLLKVIRCRDLSVLSLPPLFTWLFVLQSALSLLRTGDLIGSAKEIIQGVEYFVLAFMLFASNLRRPKHLDRAVFLFLAVATAVVLVGAAQYLRTDSVPDFGVGGTLGNRNVLGGFLALSLPVFFGLMVHDRNLWRRVWYALVVLIGLIVNLSGGTFMALFVAFAVISGLKSRNLCLGVTCVFLLLATVLLPRLPRHNGEVLLDSVAMYREGEATTRYPEWQAAVAMTRENVWLGVGAGTYQDHIGRYYGILPSPSVSSEPDSQNLYLVLASSMGVPGLLFFVGMLLVFGCEAARTLLRAPHGRDQGLAAGLMGSVIAFAVNSVWAPLLVRGIGLPLALVFSLAMALRHSHEQQPG